jgi:hypothetical protein
MADAIRLTSPLNGDILNRHDGTVTPAGLEVTVTGEAAAGRAVTVTCRSAADAAAATSVPAVRRGGRFEARLLLQGRHNTITASDGAGEHSIRVLWDRDSVPRYRFSMDDNVLFLKDIARGSYRSLFDHWYLGFLRGLHRKYGTKVHINVFWQTDESVFDGPQFRLPEMPDRYKGEWRDNADWLHLTFHGWQNDPDRPYRYAGYEQVAYDYDAVTSEIARFAGEDTIGKFTTMHWAEAPKAAVKALRDRGVIGLMGGFIRSESMNTGYYLPDDLEDHVEQRDYWWDSDIDVRYVTNDATLNLHDPQNIGPHLDRRAGNSRTGELLEMIVHEEYFRPELHWYLPHVQETCELAVRWAYERGYKPVFWGEGFYGV